VRVGVPAATAEDFASGEASKFAMIVFDLSVNDGVSDAFRDLRGVYEGGAVDEGGGIEDSYVGEIAGFDDAAVFKVFALRGKGSDFADGSFKRH